MWPHLFFSHPKDKHTLFNCASWVGHQSTMVFGPLSPAAALYRGTTLALYPQPAPLAHTAIPLIQLFLIFKTQKHNSYFFFIFWPWGSHTPKVTGQGSHTQVLFGWGHNTKKTNSKQQTVDKQTNTQPDQDANVPKWHFSKPTHWAFRKPLTLPTMSSIPLVVSAAPLSLPDNAP